MPREKEPLVISTDGTSGPYIMVPSEEGQALSEYLKGHDVQSTLDEGAVSSGGQSILDAVSLGVINDSRMNEIRELLNGFER